MTTRPLRAAVRPAVAAPQNPYRPPPDPPQRRSTPIPATDLLLAIGSGAAIVTCWPLVLAVRGAQPIQPIGLVAHLCGMLAGYGVIVLVGLMSRAPALERDIGADVLTRWHAQGGRAVTALIAVHAWAAVAAWASSRHQSSAVALWHVLGLPSVATATVGTILLFAVAAASVRAARRRISYERWHAMHLLTYVAIALSFTHQLAGPDLAGYRPVQIAWALLYTSVFALLIRHRLLTPLRQAARHRLRVAAVVPEAPGIVSIEIEGQHLQELEAESGQFFRWRFLTPDHWLGAHPFSLSAPPAEHRLRLTVKDLGQGSAHLQDIAVGTWVIAEGPYGALTAARRTRNDVLLIAGGVGITPMRALFETMPLAPGQDLTLLYRARRIEDLVFRDELDRIAAIRNAHVFYLVGEDRRCLSASSLQRLVPGLVQRDVYLCGPPALSAGVRQSLRTLGLPSDRLHEERFSW